MDHSMAHLTEFSEKPLQSKLISSKFTHDEKSETFAKSEHIMHNKEQHQLSAYYKILGEEILKYHDVLLFGPTDAKLELYNILKADHHFDKIRIVTASAGKLTEPQQHAFVRDYFAKELVPKTSDNN